MPVPGLFLLPLVVTLPFLPGEPPLPPLFPWRVSLSRVGRGRAKAQPVEAEEELWVWEPIQGACPWGQDGAVPGS